MFFFTQPMLDFRIVLEAKNPDRRCFRQYRVEAGTDLFGSWDEGEARHLAQSILKRRAIAPRRIGVTYRIRELIDPTGWAGASLPTER